MTNDAFEMLREAWMNYVDNTATTTAERGEADLDWMDICEALEIG